MAGYGGGRLTMIGTMAATPMIVLRWWSDGVMRWGWDDCMMIGMGMGMGMGMGSYERPSCVCVCVCVCVCSTAAATAMATASRS